MLTEDARTVLRAIGGWPCADLLLQPEQGAKTLRTSMLGGTINWTDGSRRFFSCESRYIEVHALDGDPDDKAGPTRRPLFLLRYAVVAEHAATLSPEVRAELHDARREYHAENMRWTLDREVPPGAEPKPFDPEAWDAHMARWVPVDKRLRAAVRAAIEYEAPVAEQLDLFGALA